MCGRYTLTSPERLLEEFGGSELPFAIVPRYNIAPTQRAPVLVCRGRSQGPQIRMLHWGFCLGAGFGQSSAKFVINARAETMEEKSLFRESFFHRRCLVCADGFLEWKRCGRQALPFYMRRKDGGLMMLAGLWREDTFVILTTEANAMMSPVHHRMPIVISREQRQDFLEASSNARGCVRAMLVPPREIDYEFFRVSERVNSAANDEPACLRRGSDQQDLF